MVYGFDFTVLGAKILKDGGRRICLLDFLCQTVPNQKEEKVGNLIDLFSFGEPYEKNKRFGMALIVSDLQAETFVFIRL